MKRKGFTLIELLAVIVILAIIALIATPIVLNIIENTKEEANKRSIDMYVRGVKNAIATYHLEHKKSPQAGYYTTEDGVTLQYKENGVVKDTITVDYDGNIVCETISVTSVGEVTLFGCRVNDSSSTYKYENGKTEEEEPICKLIDDVAPTGISEGDKYLCAVEEDMDLENDEGYTFFVLPGQNADGKTNLIMYANINASGQPVDSDTVAYKGAVAWYNENSCEDDNSCTNEYGPVTAMDYLNTATSSWITQINETYDDEGDNYGTITLNGKARLPKLSEVSDYKSDGTNAYLYDYMADLGYQTNDISGVYGYWILASDADYSDIAWSVFSEGFVDNDDTSNIVNNNNYGVRPVITVSIDDIQQN
ncbi:MAG: prepilin-type N-terminal cleavage/methylation domain-containing protein [Firmicutes bacterium]|nr:prepilin-type N-terminal cleavage/methylation domain-containing protein [Bacillota bacterium]